jgi:hypothetical protein
MLEAVLGFTSASSQIPNDVIENARTICRSGALQSEVTNTNPEIPCELPDIIWGKHYIEKVDRLTSLFYRLSVNEVQFLSGFIISCESYNKDKFKVVIFDASGEIIEEVYKVAKSNVYHSHVFKIIG